MTRRAHNSGIKALLGCIEEVRKHYPRMELGQLVVLLRILDKPSVTAAELVKLTGFSKASLSRAVRLLGSDPYTNDGDGQPRDTGLNLITQIKDYEDPRVKILAPTRIGRRLGEEFERIIGEANGSIEGQPLASGHPNPGG